MERLRAAGLPVAGFVTREIREAGRRRGFEVANLAGGCALLASVDLPGPPRVGRYGVDLPAFERVALPALAAPAPGAVVVIDELGKMELASERFRAAVAELLERPLAFVATVHVFRHPFTDALKRRPGVETLRVEPRTRDGLPERVERRLAASASEAGQAPGARPRRGAAPAP